MSTQQVGAVGIDFGSLRSVIAVAKKGGVDVLSNQASNRETPNVVGYGDKERLMGEQGFARAKSNFKNTCAFPSRMVGLPADYPLIKEEKKWVTCKFGQNEAGELAYDVTNKGERSQFTAVQVAAAMIGEIKRILVFNDINDKEAVISVPNYFTERERKALLDAAKIADLKIQRIFSESSATTLSYGLFRKKDLPEKDEKARNVVFVDLGHSKMSSFVSSFTKDKCSVLLQENDRHLGARDLDWALLEFYDELFQKSSGGLSILESKKAILRAIDAIQKQRKTLSANTASAISAECLVEDCDLNYDMTRDEFEKLIAGHLVKVKENLLRLKAKIDEKKLDIHSVEIVGGATRIPAVQALIKETFGIEISRTLNQTECIARGCAMMAAYCSPQFRVAEYQLDECNNYPIKIQWQFLNGGNMIEEGKTATFFDAGCSIPNIKSLSFNRMDGIQLNLFYDPVPEGFSPEVIGIKIPAANPKEMDCTIKTRVKLNSNGIVELTEAALIEKYKVEEKVLKPKKPEEKKDGEKKEGEEDKKEEDEYEIKIKDKTRTTQLTSDVNTLNEMIAARIDECFNKENEMKTNDRIIQETNQKKNELETYIYEWRDRISGSYSAYTVQADVASHNSQLDESANWLENEGESSCKSQYVAKIDALKKTFQPIYDRYLQFDQLPNAFSQIEQVVLFNEQFVASQDEKFAHITAEQRQPIVDEVQKVKARLQEAQAKLNSQPKFENPCITVQEIDTLKNALINLARPIMATPKPAPPKEEKKEEEKAGEEKTEEKQQENKQEEQTGEQQKQSTEKMEVE